MNETDIRQYITTTFASVDEVINSGTRFFFYNPDEPLDHRYPFITLMTTDDSYDQFSNLNRDGVFRLNIGISKETFRARFGTEADPVEIPEGYDFTALDQVMPHPVYGKMHWVCILNPSEKTFDTDVRPLIAEAYEMAVSRRTRQHPA